MEAVGIAPTSDDAQTFSSTGIVSLFFGRLFLLEETRFQKRPPLFDFTLKPKGCEKASLLVGVFCRNRRRAVDVAGLIKQREVIHRHLMPCQQFENLLTGSSAKNVSSSSSNLVRPRLYFKESIINAVYRVVRAGYRDATVFV